CVIPSGVPLPHVRAEQTGPLDLIYVGRLENRQKRIDVVLDRLVRAVVSGAARRASIVGTGSQRLALERRIAELGLEGRIRLTGHVDPDRLPEVLVQHHVAVLFSAYEGTPGALMDAMACGLIPVVTPIPGGTRELVEDQRTGLIIDHSDESLLGA